LKTFNELTDAQRSRAVEEALRRILEAIAHRGLRFNDFANGNDLQARIDAAFARAGEDDAAWRLLVMASCSSELTRLALMSARDAVVVEGEMVLSIDDL
jgi:hypothetical protein